MQLSGLTTAVTGGASGLGLATAQDKARQQATAEVEDFLRRRATEHDRSTTRSPGSLAAATPPAQRSTSAAASAKVTWRELTSMRATTRLTA